ncbi:MAG: hypothetical protein K2X52_00690 [Mycobacteriaceae bacterium]|nr:hypothetical protein [Mycobacteriaceae bacterium]
MSDSSSHGESQPLIQVAEQQPQALTQVLTHGPAGPAVELVVPRVMPA